MAHPIFGGYKPVEACSRVTLKPFQNVLKISSNQLTFPCKVLHNIIAHVVLPRKGHLDEVNHFDLFLLDSFLVASKIDFPSIIMSQMNNVHSIIGSRFLPYGMILTKKF